MAAMVPMLHKKCGRLFVEEFSHSDKGIAYWVCRCDCGTVVTVSGRALRVKNKAGHPNTASCGCLQREIASAWWTKFHARKRKEKEKAP
jgi:hypothetical protein